MEKKKDSRARNYACVVYPESAPKDWQEILIGHKVPAFISPLHDRDIDPQNQPKKEHYHVMVMFEGKKSLEQAEELFSSFNGVGCEVVKSIRGYARYLCHLDNPEKAQYDREQVRCLCGTDYNDTVGLALDKYIAIAEMMDFCDEFKVVSFYLLAKYARKNRPDWFRILCDSSAIFMREWLQSRQWSVRSGKDSIVDEESGEVLV